MKQFSKVFIPLAALAVFALAFLPTTTFAQSNSPSFQLCLGVSSLSGGGSNALRRADTQCTNAANSWLWYGMDPTAMTLSWTGAPNYNGPDFRFGIQSSESNSGTGCGVGGGSNPNSAVSWTPWASEVANGTAGNSAPPANNTSNTPDCYQVFLQQNGANAISLSSVGLGIVSGCGMAGSCAISLQAVAAPVAGPLTADLLVSPATVNITGTVDAQGQISISQSSAVVVENNGDPDSGFTVNCDPSTNNNWLKVGCPGESITPDSAQSISIDVDASALSAVPSGQVASFTVHAEPDQNTSNITHNDRVIWVQVFLGCGNGTSRDPATGNCVPPSQPATICPDGSPIPSGGICGTFCNGVPVPIGTVCPSEIPPPPPPTPTTPPKPKPAPPPQLPPGIRYCNDGTLPDANNRCSGSGGSCDPSSPFAIFCSAIWVPFPNPPAGGAAGGAGASTGASAGGGVPDCGKGAVYDSSVNGGSGGCMPVATGGGGGGQNGGWMACSDGEGCTGLQACDNVQGCGPCQINSCPAPSCTPLTADRPKIVIPPPGRSNLLWSCDRWRTKSCSISPLIGNIPVSGSQGVSPQSTTVYTLSCLGPSRPGIPAKTTGSSATIRVFDFSGGSIKEVAPGQP